MVCSKNYYVHLNLLDFIMNKNLSIVSILQTSWADLKKWKFTLFALTSIFIVVSILMTYLCFACALLSKAYVLFGCLAFIFLLGMIFLYTTIVTKNVLDIVYNRQVSWLKFPTGTFKLFLATLFTGSLSSLSNIGVNNSNLVIFIVSLVLYFLIAYFLLRVSFIPQILLEQQGSITGAFHESWNLTENRSWLLIVSSLLQGVFFLLPLLPFFIFITWQFGFNIMYREFGFNIEVTPESVVIAMYALLLFVCGIVVELYLVSPLCLLMRSHLFKALVESENL